VKKELAPVARNREHAKTRTTVEKLLVILRWARCRLIYNDDVSPGLLRRRDDVRRILHPTGNHHLGVRRNNVCDHVEKHTGHAGKQDTDAPHGGFLAPVATADILLEVNLDKMDLEAGIRMPEDRGPDRPGGPAHWADIS
jgi:hypothetical protein